MRQNVLAGLLAFALAAAIGFGQASAADRIGVVLLHGGGSSGSQFFDMRPLIEKAGYGLATPDMCWSQSRRYDKGAEACMADVDKAIEKLRADGYTRIVLGGHSQGGINALLYAARHTGLAGIIVFAPGNALGDDRNLAIAYAHRLIAEGKGEDKTSFGSGINEILATPRDYLSYVGIESPLYDLDLLPKITAPILWVAGTKDPGQTGARERFAHAPPHPLNRFVSVVADHFETPDVAVGDMIAWLDQLSGQKASD